jgi:hypothetical protein
MIGKDNETSAWMQKKVKLVLKEIKDLGEGVLDEAIHDAHSEAAAEVNNSGLASQVQYLLSNGWKPADIVSRAKQAAAENEDG